MPLALLAPPPHPHNHRPALATSLPPEDGDDAPVLCDPACAAALADKPRVTTASGLQYIDIVEGKGVSPPKGYQVCVLGCGAVRCGVWAGQCAG